jgi:hypothetical protein
MVWERAPVSFFVAVVSLVVFLIFVDLFNFEVHPFVLLILIGIYIFLTILEIWYVGDQ